MTRCPTDPMTDHQAPQTPRADNREQISYAAVLREAVKSAPRCGSTGCCEPAVMELCRPHWQGKDFIEAWYKRCLAHGTALAATSESTRPLVPPVNAAALTQLAARIEQAEELQRQMEQTQLPGPDEAWDVVRRLAAGFDPNAAPSDPSTTHGEGRGK